MMLVLLCVLGLVGQAASYPALAIVPRQQFGMLIGNGSRNSKILLEVFLDVLCPDSKQAWPTVKRVADHYTTQDVGIVIHQYPLPNHRNAYLATQGYYLAASRGKASAIAYMDTMFAHQEQFSTDNSFNMSAAQTVRKMSGLIEDISAISQDHTLRHINDYYEMTKAAWKYGARRSVAGVPAYFVNGVELVNGYSPIDDDTLTDILDVLLDKEQNVIEEPYDDKDGDTAGSGRDHIPISNPNPSKGNTKPAQDIRRSGQKVTAAHARRTREKGLSHDEEILQRIVTKLKEARDI